MKKKVYNVHKRALTFFFGRFFLEDASSTLKICFLEIGEYYTSSNRFNKYEIFNFIQNLDKAYIKIIKIN